MADKSGNAIFLWQNNTPEFSSGAICGQALFLHGFLGFVATDKCVVVFAENVNKSNDDQVLLDKAAAGKAVETVGKDILGNVGHAGSDIFGNQRVVEYTLVSTQIGEGLQKDARIDPEKRAYTMEHVRAREAFSRQVAVELGAIDSKFSA